MKPRILRAELVNNVLETGDDWAKVGRGKHLEPGVVAYDNEDGTRTTYLLTREAIAKMRASASGKPIIGKAGNFDHMKVNAADAAKGKYDGDVIKSYDGGDGWEWIDFLVRDAETKEKCQDGYQFSCAYIPTETDGKPGLWHNVPYDETILNGEYTHFAVVPQPRYEGAAIELLNSKGGLVNNALKAILKTVLPLAQLKEIVNSIEDDDKKAAAAKTAATAAEEKLNAMKPDELHEHIITNYSGEILSGSFSPEVDALFEKGAKANKSELKDYIKRANSDAKMFQSGMKNAETSRRKGEFEEAMKNAKTDEEKKLLEDAYNKANAGEEPKKDAPAAKAPEAPAASEAPKGEAPKIPVGGGDVPAEPGLPGQEKPKENAEETPEEKAAREKAELEKKNAEDAEAKKKAEEKAAQEKTNALNAKKKAAEDAAREERFNSLRRTAEERGGSTGTSFVGVVSVDEKQDLGRARYGS